MDVLEHLSVSSPRKSRKSVRELLESFEELCGLANGGAGMGDQERLKVLLTPRGDCVGLVL